MATTLRVMTNDGILISEDEYLNEFEALDAMEELEEEGLIAQVIFDDRIYAEKTI